MLNCFVVGIFLKKALPQKLQLLFWLVLVTLIVEGIGTYYLNVLRRPAGLAYRLYQPVEYLLMAAYFFHIISFAKVRTVILASIPIIVITNIINILVESDNRLFGTYSFLTSAILLSVWSIIYFYQLIQEAEIRNPARNPDFWICTGILFFYAGTFFLMGCINYIYKNNTKLAQELYVINHLLNCILYGMITYGFICQAKYQKS
ncbi:hypothetical protein [Dyadobacter sp. BHUBP1]|uniref:hypothetical protein n=1 Tax=Dyadobacter sp. BHUBP1 TaxID=3424178 RepID=UPI003D3436F2